MRWFASNRTASLTTPFSGASARGDGAPPDRKRSCSSPSEPGQSMKDVYENFDIRVLKGTGRKYKLIVKYPGVQPADGRVVNCELPPDYNDLLIEPPPGLARPSRKVTVEGARGFIHY